MVFVNPAVDPEGEPRKRYDGGRMPKVMRGGKTVISSNNIKFLFRFRDLVDLVAPTISEHRQVQGEGP
jgi:hypothetical protein